MIYIKSNTINNIKIPVSIDSNSTLKLTITKSITNTIKIDCVISDVNYKYTTITFNTPSDIDGIYSYNLYQNNTLIYNGLMYANIEKTNIDVISDDDTNNVDDYISYN